MTTTDARLTLGLDIGGTSTRAVVVDTTGRRLGAGRAAGANLTAHAPDRALDAVAAALADALAPVDPAAVAAAVIGTAGDRNLTRPEIASALADRWKLAGLSCDYEVVADAVVAYVSGTPTPDGTLVLSGTGALAARLAGRRIAQICDGHGWLLGDRGSGFWIGQAAVRATLAALDRQTMPGPLGRAVVRTLLGRAEFDPAAREVAADLVMTVHAQPPVALAALAPLVTGHAGTDPAADRILAAAADHLLAAARVVRPDGDASPIVLAGSLLTADTPLAGLVRPRLAEAWPAAVVSRALDGAAGAAWLAAVALDPAAAEPLHAALFG